MVKHMEGKWGSKAREAYWRIYFDMIMYIMLRFEEVLAIAKRQHARFGRGYIPLAFLKYYELAQETKIRLCYAGVNSADDSILLTKLVTEYDPSNAFVLSFTCMDSFKHKDGPFYIHAVVSRKDAMNTIADEFSGKTSLSREDFVSKLYSDKNFLQETCKEFPLYTRFELDRSLISGKSCLDHADSVVTNLDKKTTNNLMNHYLDSLLFHCDACKKELKRLELKKCSACKMAIYCSKECQQVDWKNHKVKCKSVKQ
jgi:hypothetical protein